MEETPVAKNSEMAALEASILEFSNEKLTDSMPLPGSEEEDTFLQDDNIKSVKKTNKKKDLKDGLAATANQKQDNGTDHATSNNKTADFVNSDISDDEMYLSDELLSPPSTNTPKNNRDGAKAKGEQESKDETKLEEKKDDVEAEEEEEYEEEEETEDNNAKDTSGEIYEEAEEGKETGKDDTDAVEDITDPIINEKKSEEKDDQDAIEDREDDEVKATDDEVKATDDDKGEDKEKESSSKDEEGAMDVDKDETSQDKIDSATEPKGISECKERTEPKENSSAKDSDDDIEIIEDEEPFTDIVPIVELEEGDEPLNVAGLSSSDAVAVDSDDDFDPSSLLAVVHDDEAVVSDNESSRPASAVEAEEKQTEDDDKDKSQEEIVMSVVTELLCKLTSDEEAGKEKCLVTDEKSCAECRINKGLKYQVLFHGKTHYLCSDNCFYVFRNRQKLAPPPSSLSKKPKEDCLICKAEIKNGQGFFPLDADSTKPVCSEACIKKFQAEHGAKQTCAQCKAHIEGRNKCLTWETMEFCNEDCLGKYQAFLGSYCACCKNAVQRLSLGKYCVRFGLDIRQFCSGKCLEEFKKGLKVCTFCQKDLTGAKDSFLAPVGHKGQFKDFCTQECMAQYETVNTAASKTPLNKLCSVCKKVGPVKVQVIFNKQEHVLCSDQCVASFRYANKIVTKICDTCNKFFKSQSSPLQFEGASKRFCSKACMNLFVLSHRKIVPCTWCKVKKYNFDMIERVDSNNHVQLFCSLNCLSLFRVSLNATSSKSVQCDNCKLNLPAQYHLTMSDASIRNFCTYQCVIQFQCQFTSVPTLTTVTPNARGTNQVVTTAAGGGAKSVPAVAPPTSTTPIISSVISLAPSGAKSMQSGTIVMGANKGVTVQGLNITPVNRAQTNIVQANRNLTPATRNQGNSTPISRNQQNIINMPQITKTTTAAGTTTLPSAAVHVMREIVVRPTQPKVMKNKMIMCKPLMQTKGVACKPHPCHKCTQTEEVEEGPVRYVPIPIPVPIYVPVPTHLYSRPYPFPLPFVLPVPVPIFVPTTKSTTEQIVKDIKEITEKIPDNPFEAELLMMAEMVASEGVVNQEKSFSFISEASKSSCDIPASPKVDNSLEASISHLPLPIAHLDLETALIPPTFESQFEAAQLQPHLMQPHASELEPISMSSFHHHQQQHHHHQQNNDDDDDDYVADDPDDDTYRSSSRKKKNKKRKSESSKGGRGKKKSKRSSAASMAEAILSDLDESSELMASSDPSVFLASPKSSNAMGGDSLASPDANLCLKFMFGVNAWKHWVVLKNTQLEKGSQARKLKLFKTDLLQLSPDELNYSLCLFVKEVRKPNGEEYAPDSIYYLCLGIQMYLFENSRVDNIFTDAYYEKFTECLNEVVQKQETVVLIKEGLYVSRIEEEILWESKQLGAHSPHVLLNTLMYFNSKFFMLKTVEDHLQLNFSQIMKHWRKTSSTITTGIGATAITIPSGTKISVLRYYPPVQKENRRNSSGSNKKEEQQALEQVENVHNLLRCPVKLYEFYLSKCVKTRSDMFYLYPERSCVPESPVWYSAQPLGRETISKMLYRVRMVREICNPSTK